MSNSWEQIDGLTTCQLQTTSNRTRAKGTWYHMTHIKHKTELFDMISVADMCALVSVSALWIYMFFICVCVCRWCVLSITSKGNYCWAKTYQQCTNTTQPVESGEWKVLWRNTLPHRLAQAFKHLRMLEQTNVGLHWESTHSGMITGFIFALIPVHVKMQLKWRTVVPIPNPQGRTALAGSKYLLLCIWFRWTVFMIRIRCVGAGDV